MLAVFQKKHYSKHYGFSFPIYFYAPVYKAKFRAAQICEATSIWEFCVNTSAKES